MKQASSSEGAFSFMKNDFRRDVAICGYPCEPVKFMFYVSSGNPHKRKYA